MIIPKISIVRAKNLNSNFSHLAVSLLPCHFLLWATRKQVILLLQKNDRKISKLPPLDGHGRCHKMGNPSVLAQLMVILLYTSLERTNEAPPTIAHVYMWMGQIMLILGAKGPTGTHLQA